MKKTKILLSILMMFTFITPNVFADSNDSFDYESEDIVIDLFVDKNNIEAIIEKYDIPIEVQQSISNIFQRDSNATVTISNVEERNGRAASGAWSSTRSYGKYQLRDWIISSTGSTGSQRVKTGEKTYGDVLGKIGFVVSGYFMDIIFPFTTAISVLEAFKLGNSYAASGSDKLDVSFTVTCKEKFTYVVIGNQKMLGAKSYYSVLNEGAWTFYSDKQNKHYQKIVTYNKSYISPTFAHPDPRAATSFGSGGFIDEPPSIKIENVTFYLY